MSVAVQIQQLWASLRSAVTRGIVSSSNDEKATQTLQADLRFDEASSDIEHFQPFGLSFRPTSNSEVIVLATGASQDNLVAILATDRSARPKGIKEGEGGLYTPSGWKVFLNEDHEVCIADQAPVDWVARADRVDAEIKTIRDAITNAKFKVQDGGETLQSTMVTALGKQGKTKSDKGRVT